MNPIPALNRTDALVIGADPAGLSAALAIAEAGLAVIVPEARVHTGGRVWPERQQMTVPAEFGTELVHGDPGATIAGDLPVR